MIWYGNGRPRKPFHPQRRAGIGPRTRQRDSRPLHPRCSPSGAPGAGRRRRGQRRPSPVSPPNTTPFFEALRPHHQLKGNNLAGVTLQGVQRTTPLRHSQSPTRPREGGFQRRGDRQGGTSRKRLVTPRLHSRSRASSAPGRRLLSRSTRGAGVDKTSSPTSWRPTADRARRLGDSWFHRTLNDATRMLTADPGTFPATCGGEARARPAAGQQARAQGASRPIQAWNRTPLGFLPSLPTACP